MVFWLGVAWLGSEFYFLEIYGNGFLIDFS